MIHESHGNLLDSDVEALVNTVNTVVVMGKGIALQFRRRFPDMFRAYERAAKRGEVHLGQMHVWDTGAMTGPRFIATAFEQIADVDADDIRARHAVDAEWGQRGGSRSARSGQPRTRVCRSRR